MVDTSIKSNNTDIVGEIKDRLDIFEVVSESVVLKKSGRNFWGLCPFHGEKTPSFSVNPDKGIFKCFGCGEGGDAISFLMKINHSTFYETIVELAEKFGLPLPQFGQSAEKNELKKRIYEINLSAANYYRQVLLENSEAKHAKEYLFAREIDREVIERFNIGYSPKHADGLINHLVEKYKVDFDLLDKAGLVSKRTTGAGYCDRFRNRIMIPIQDEKANVIAFGGRVLDEGQNPKYLNSPDTVVFNKSRSLFAICQAKETIKSEDKVIIMEGYFDVISAHAHGLTNVVATLGTALTEHHIRILAKYTDSRKIYLAFDSDEAGINATSRGAEVIKSAFTGLGSIKQFDENFAASSDVDNRFSCEIRVITTHAGKDPDEFIRNNGIDAYKNLVNQAPLLIDYQINRIINSKNELNSPQDKGHLSMALIPILAEVKNSVIRNEYVRLVSERLEIDEESFAHEVKKTLQKKPIKKGALKPIVTKKLEKHILAQKNLLSLYFINSDKFSNLCINDLLKEVSFTEPNFLLIQKQLAEIIDKTNNIEELTEELLKNLAENEEAKQVVVDVIFSLDDKNHLDGKILKQYISENISCINQYLNLKEQNQLKVNYHSAKDDELSALQLQYQVRELIKSNQTRLEPINEQKS